MIDAIINFFTDNHIGYGISKFFMRFVNYRRLLDASNEIDDPNTIEYIKQQFDILLREADRMQQYDVAYLLLVKQPNSYQWEITAVSAKYKYLTNVLVPLNLSKTVSTDSYFIRLL